MSDDTSSTKTKNKKTLLALNQWRAVEVSWRRARGDKSYDIGAGESGQMRQ